MYTVLIETSSGSLKILYKKRQSLSWNHQFIDLIRKSQWSKTETKFRMKFVIFALLFATVAVGLYDQVRAQIPPISPLESVKQALLASLDTLETAVNDANTAAINTAFQSLGG